jgi:hypothetical protein
VAQDEGSEFKFQYWKKRKKKNLVEKGHIYLGMMACMYNPSYSGSRGQKDCSL